MSNKRHAALRHGHDLPEWHLLKLVSKIHARNEKFRALDKDFPHPRDPKIELTSDPAECVFPGRHPSISWFYAEQDAEHLSLGARGRRRRRRRGGGSGGGTGSGGKKWPDPKVVRAEVQKMYNGVPVAGSAGPIVVGATNWEFWNKSKAIYFEDAANEVLSHHHFMHSEEVDSPGLGHTAKIAGYKSYVCTANSRGQAVGHLVHPRLELKAGPFELDTVKNVQNIPDLRPGYMAIYQDTATKQYIVFITVHLKSMLGGPKVTSVVRYKQLQNLITEMYQVLARELPKLGVKLADIGIVIAGDFNFPLIDKTFNDGDPLYNDGFQLLEKADTRGTQVSRDTRIDGFFHKNVKAGLVDYTVYAYYKSKTLGRALTDHATITCKWPVTKASTTSGGTGSASKGSTTDKSGGAKSETDADSQTAAEGQSGGGELPPIRFRPLPGGRQLRSSRRR